MTPEPSNGAGYDAPTPLTPEEQKSLTHGDFWIEAGERAAFARALAVLNRAGIPFVVSGLYALHHYTGIYRKTKDLDLLFKPTDVLEAARVLRDDGFRTRLEGAHWLGKAFLDDAMVDLVFGMANGLHLIDAGWHRHSRPGLLAGVPVRVAPAEELILHRLFIAERHRSDAGDVSHLMMLRGSQMDWRRLLRRVGDHWRLLLSQVLFFDFAYPGRRSQVPAWVREELLERAAAAVGEMDPDPHVSQGTLVSRFSFAIDVNEWGFRDYRREAVMATRSLPIIHEIAASDVWQSVNDEPEYRGRPSGRGPARLPSLNEEAADDPGSGRRGASGDDVEPTLEEVTP